MRQDTARTICRSVESVRDFFADGRGFGAGAGAANLLLVVSVQKRNGLFAD